MDTVILPKFSNKYLLFQGKNADLSLIKQYKLWLKLPFSLLTEHADYIATYEGFIQKSNTVKESPNHKQVANMTTGNIQDIVARGENE